MDARNAVWIYKTCAIQFCNRQPIYLAVTFRYEDLFVISAFCAEAMEQNASKPPVMIPSLGISGPS